MSDINYTSGNQVANAIEKRIIAVAKQAINKSSVNKTVYGRVTEKNNGLFSVKINNAIYTDVLALKDLGYIKVGDSVVCLVPNNQFNNLIILGVADGTLMPADVSSRIELKYADGQLQYKYESEEDWVTIFTVDDALSDTSTNPIQNKTVTNIINNKLDTNQGMDNAGKFLTVGNDGNVVPSSGSGAITLHPDYDSGWFDFSNATTYTFTHNLNTTEFYTLIDVKFNGENPLYTQNSPINSDGTSNSYAGGINETYRTATQIWLRGAKNYALNFSSAADANGYFTDFSARENCQARVRLFKIV